MTLAALSRVLGTGDQADDVGTADGMSPLDIVTDKMFVHSKKFKRISILGNTHGRGGTWQRA